ncbi:hypothetical protein [Parafrankia sp. EUN1f]|uniref:hypothetical protein n=1 Tax=Parafrankia sp. EUN1f TaxID=102897 RepID=UPI0001C44230|nr:hypothetical protein [Parafrankia sp. EUN1f]EFC85792.1 conserved hypothetical protein [Parafrankia sp. EUN1f]
MARFQVVVLTRAVEGRRDELARWYDAEHIPDHLRVPGFMSGTRFTVNKLDAPTDLLDWDFMAVYELETDDPAAVIAEARRRLGTAEMPVSPALDMSQTIAVLTTPAFSSTPTP